MRLLVLASAVAIARIAHAQPDAAHHLRTVDGTIASEKLFHEVLLTMDPSGRASFERMRVKVRLAPTVPLSSLLEQLAASEAGIFVEEFPSPGHVRMDEFPVVLDSGNPAEDAEVYARAKMAWIQAHPGLYQGLQEGVTGDRPNAPFTSEEQ